MGRPSSTQRGLHKVINTTENNCQFNHSAITVFIHPLVTIPYGMTNRAILREEGFAQEVKLMLRSCQCANHNFAPQVTLELLGVGEGTLRLAHHGMAPISK